jgi:phosphatidylserine decarboxylase
MGRMLERPAINFLLTNRIPRRRLTLFLGWLSRIEHPWVCALCVAAWRRFTELDLSDAQKTRFTSLHDVFTRELKAGARPLDADPRRLTSPCDALVGACGPVRDGMVLQAKGHPYPLAELTGDADLAGHYAGGQFVTLRLTSAMYHRFHAPYACRVSQVDYFPGDTWNVNPAALDRVERLYCKNERAVIRCRLVPGGELITLVPVAAILVASLRLKFLDLKLHLRYRGPHRLACDAPLAKGEEMGWFEHGSTIIVFAPAGFALGSRIEPGTRIRMGQPLFEFQAD